MRMKLYRLKSSSYLRFLLTLASFIIILNCIAIYNYIFHHKNLKRNKSNSHDKYDQRNVDLNEDSQYISKDIKIEIRDNEKYNVYRINRIKIQNAETNIKYIHRKLLNSSDEGEFPQDIFTVEQKRDGLVVLHIIGVCYMFLGIALVCDEFFVPALHLISKICNISDDVAGATFMAAGGSAPELFISFIGLFVSKSNVGFGTIVGSAVFNVLFVIGMCAIFSKTVLQLTWWPLLRDCLFYIAALSLLIGFFSDQMIEYWEAILLFVMYILYVLFMFSNEKIEQKVKQYLAKRKGSCVRPASEEPVNKVSNTVH